MAILQGGLAALLLLIALSSRPVSSRFVVEKNNIKVLYPEHIRGKHDGAIANFGVPNYGGTMRGVVIYPSKGATGCDAFDGPPFKSQSGRPVILLLDRGDCYFATKTWNAQQAGAAAVLVADNIDEPLITMDNPEESMSSQSFVEKNHHPIRPHQPHIRRESQTSLIQILRRSLREARLARVPPPPR